MTAHGETQGMTLFRSPRSAALTLLAVVLIAIGVGGLIAGPALANSFGPPWHGGAGWQRDAVPAELAGLADVPAGERFAHFRGVQVQLTDRDNRPLRVDVTPGSVTSVSDTALTIAANDGASRTFALDDKTMQRGQTVKQNDKVVVATLNGSTTATAVFAVDGARGPWRH
jgi:hypothetical protein